MKCYKEMKEVDKALVSLQKKDIKKVNAATYYSAWVRHNIIFLQIKFKSSWACIDIDRIEAWGNPQNLCIRNGLGRGHVNST
jgi:hypothetical protein